MSDTLVVMADENCEAPQKTAKQLEKEAKKQAKLDKLKQKLEKKSNVVVSIKKEPIVVSSNCTICERI